MSESLVQSISSLKNVECKIFLHHNADPDAISAAEALGKLILKLVPQSVYKIYSDGINTSATRLMDEYKVNVHDEDNPTWIDDYSKLLITVDSANFSQLGKYQGWIQKQGNIELIVIDHHDTTEISDEANITIRDPNASSTCVMIYELYQTEQITPSPRIATLLISGHIYDSRRFLYGSSAELFDIISDLISAGGDYEMANHLLQNEMSFGERVARFKAAQRIYFETIDEKIIATSKIGAFEASSARTFISMGADVAMVLAPKNNELRGSARVRSRVELNIGEIMEKVGEKFDGSGGGHAAAAGFNIQQSISKKTQKEISKYFIKLVKQKFEGSNNNS